MVDTKAKRGTVKSTRLNQTESRALEAIAELKARSASETLRELVRREAVELGVWPTGRRVA